MKTDINNILAHYEYKILILLSELIYEAELKVDECVGIDITTEKKTDFPHDRTVVSKVKLNVIEE